MPIKPVEDFTTQEKTDFLAAINAETSGAAAAAQAAAVQRANHTGEQAISTVTGLQTALDGKQSTLVSGTNIKTVNGSSVLGSGDLPVGGTWGSITGTLSDQTDLSRMTRIGSGPLGVFYRRMYDRFESGSFSLAVVKAGDSYSVSPAAQLEALYGRLGGFLCFPGLTLGGGAALASPSDFTKSPTGNYVNLGLNQTVRWNPSNVGISGSVIKVLYRVDPNAGSFKIQHRRIDLGSFTDALTVDASVSVNGPTNAAMAAVTVTPGTYEIGVIGATSGKAVEIIGMGIDYGPRTSLANRSGVTSIGADIGGSTVAQWNQTPQHIWDAFYGGTNGLKPDIVFYKADDSPALWLADFPALVAKIKAANADTEIVVVGRHPIANGTAAEAKGWELTADDIAVRDMCDANGYIYVPSKLYMPDAGDLQDQGLLRTDDGGYHLIGGAGNDYQNQIIMDWMWPLQNPVNKANGGPTTVNKNFIGNVAGVRYPDSQVPNWYMESDMDQKGGFIGWRNTSGGSSANPGVVTGLKKVSDLNAAETHKGSLSVVINDLTREFFNTTGNALRGGGNWNSQNVTNSMNAVMTLLCGNSSTQNGLSLGTTSSPNASTYPLELRKDAAFNANGTQVMRMSNLTGKLNYLGGGADALTGSFTLVAGVATVNTTSAATNDHVNVTINTPGGTMGTHYKVTIVNGTSITITAIDNSGATVTTDTSSGTWEIAKGRF